MSFEFKVRGVSYEDDMQRLFQGEVFSAMSILVSHNASRRFLEDNRLDGIVIGKFAIKSNSRESALLISFLQKHALEFKSLDLRRSRFTFFDSLRLANVIHSMSDLRELYLNGNQLNDFSFMRIAKKLPVGLEKYTVHPHKNRICMSLILALYSCCTIFGTLYYAISNSENKDDDNIRKIMPVMIVSLSSWSFFVLSSMLYVSIYNKLHKFFVNKTLCAFSKDDDIVVANAILNQCQLDDRQIIYAKRYVTSILNSVEVENQSNLNDRMNEMGFGIKLCSNTESCRSV